MNALEAKFLTVLRFIQEQGSVEQTRIARALGFSLMTINKIVNTLVRSGIIVKYGKTSGGSGRRSDLFRFNPELFISIGADINEDRIIISAVRSDGSIIANKEYTLDKARHKSLTSGDITRLIERNYHQFTEDFMLDRGKIAVIGIAPEGIIDSENGRCLLGTHLGGIIDLNLKYELQEILHLPTFIDDPARSVAYYESKYGDGINTKNFIYMYLGKGVGSGIIIDGKIYRGFRGIAGEIGHIIIDKNGSRCKCGNYGCLETIASEESIIRQVKEGIGEGVFTKIIDYCHGEIEKISLKVLKKAADDNDKFSHNILEHVGNQLGKAVSLLINIFNPELVLIGGMVAILGDYLLDSVKRVIKNETLNIMNEKTEIRISNYNENKDSTGIAIEAFDALFRDANKESRNFIDTLFKKILHRHM